MPGTILALANRRKAFSDAVYRLHHRRTKRLLFWTCVQVLLGTAFAALGSVVLLYTDFNTLFCSLFTASFLVMIVCSIAGLINQFRGRLLPYFQKPLGQNGTLLIGKSLLWHSRELDDLALELGLRPLSEFCSGDELIGDEQLVFYPPQDALKTTEKLLAWIRAVGFPQDLICDLAQLRKALRNAVERQVNFCLLLREGPGATGQEMQMRLGSFF